jgi:hypothetical protein
VPTILTLKFIGIMFQNPAQVFASATAPAGNLSLLSVFQIPFSPFISRSLGEC